MGRFSGKKKQNRKIWSSRMGSWEQFKPSHFALLFILIIIRMSKDVNLKLVPQNIG